MFQAVSTDQDGHFHFKGVEPGEYQVAAWENIEDRAYLDPEFLKQHETNGEAVSITQRVDIQQFR